MSRKVTQTGTAGLQRTEIKELQRNSVLQEVDIWKITFQSNDGLGPIPFSILGK
jgi:hypothetical protein